MKPVAHPCRGPDGRAGDYQKRAHHPLSGARETWLAPRASDSQTVAAGMLLQQRPTWRVLCYATAKLLRDEAECMVPNIDPEQVRRLARWGLTQNDRASIVGWCPQPSAVGPGPPQPEFRITFTP